jgi:hypothetical protein
MYKIVLKVKYYKIRMAYKIFLRRKRWLDSDRLPPSPGSVLDHLRLAE